MTQKTNGGQGQSGILAKIGSRLAGGYLGHPLPTAFVYNTCLRTVLP